MWLVEWSVLITFLCGTLLLPGWFPNSAERQAGAKYYPMRHGKGSSSCGIFFSSPLYFAPRKGWRIPLQDFWHQVQISWTHTWFLIFLLALYFTGKGVGTNLQVPTFLVYYQMLGFCCFHFMTPEVKLSLLPLAVLYRFRWLECVSKYHLIVNTRLGYIVVIALCYFSKMCPLCVLRQSRDGLKGRKDYSSATMFFLSTNAVT